ncbi:MAG: hypothetical protein KDA60_14400 [Planctomycetales bacterium]|nr:hypothetical protein [Planctomycetales bacterium]
MIAVSLLSWSPPLAGVFAFGVLVGMVSMLIYWWLSPQEKIADVQQQAAVARKALQAYDGDDIRMVGALSKRAFGLSFLQIGLVLGPTLAAIVPMLAAAYWADQHYHLAERELFARGPSWCRSWHTAFWTPLCLAAITLKLRFGIK